MHFTSAIGTHQVILLFNDSLFTSIKRNGQLPDQLWLSNYPNPFSGITTVSFSMNRQSKVKIDLLDLEGGM